MEEWQWSSYNALIGRKMNIICRDKTLKWFGNGSEFIDFHRQPIYLKESLELEEL
jgi:hypothetical protein